MGIVDSEPLATTRTTRTPLSTTKPCTAKSLVAKRRSKALLNVTFDKAEIDEGVPIGGIIGEVIDKLAQLAAKPQLRPMRHVDQGGAQVGIRPPRNTTTTSMVESKIPF